MSTAAPLIFDRHLLRLRRDRAAATVAGVAPVLEAAAERLLDRLDDIKRNFTHALEIGGRGVVAPMLRARGIPFVVSQDLSARMASLSGHPAVAADEEWLPFAPESFDLVVSNLALHWVNDLPGALLQIRRTLRPDGLFLASLPGLGTLQPLRESLAISETELRGGVSPRISPFPELRDLAALLQRTGFALPVADAEDMPLAYATPMGLLRDLRAAGETNAIVARDPRTPPRALLPMALAALGQPMTQALKLLVMTGWAPHESQSRPARPGSANIRLADALGATEHSTGEKPRRA